MMGLNIQYYLAPILVLFTIESDITQVTKVLLHMFFPHSYVKIKIDTYESLPLEKTLPLHNDIIFIILVYNRNKNKNNDNNKNNNKSVHIDDIYI